MARVLVIEDDESTRLLVSTHLTRAGHKVVGVGSGEAALAAVEERGAPDVIVMDVGLPDVNGFELLASLRERTESESLPAIFVTGYVSEEDVERGRSMGARYLTKPYVATALLDAVKKMTEVVEEGW